MIVVDLSLSRLFPAVVLVTGLLLAPGSAEELSQKALSLLADRCFACHGPDASQRQAELRLDTAAGATRDLGGHVAVRPFAPEDSTLWHRIQERNPEDRMPPPDSGVLLTNEEKETLRRWIADGADYPLHWAFVPPRRHDPPATADHPVDAFIEARLQREGLPSVSEASPARLIRRLSLDLNGLPPTPEEVAAFENAYAAQGESAYLALVDRLLASPRYGETMALPWLDAARYADTDGYQFDGPRSMWRWRDWVIEAYNAKMPFDQFTREQLAGDLLPDASPSQHLATGFNRNHRYNSEAGIVVEEFLLENAVDRVDTTATLWMGLTLGCARCHDHKYDPFSQREYYQLLAFFNSVPEAGRAIKHGNSEPVMLAPTWQQERAWADRQSNLREARDAVTRRAAAIKALPAHPPQLSAEPVVQRHLKHRWLPETPPLPQTHPLVLGNVDESLAFRADQRFTISFWVRPDSLEPAVLLSRQNLGSTRPGVEIALVDEGKVRFDLITRWMAGVGRITSHTSLTPGRWTHLTLSNDGSQSARGQSLYIDGKRAAIDVSFNTNSNVGGVRSDRPLLLGGGVRADVRPFLGAFRDVRLYGETLWPEEIAILGLPSNHPDRLVFKALQATTDYGRYRDLREESERFERTLPTVMVMKEEAEKATHVRRRGRYDDPGERVERDVPRSLLSWQNDWPRNRLGLAHWLLDPRHPLTARVAVNRHWQYLFGVGLVKTAEDFGLQGSPPSHPALLDWLATELVRGGWNVAALQKLLVTSAAYRRASHLHPATLETDPDNRLLSRGPRRRLSGHVIRDQALAVSGLLQERLGGPSVSPYQPENLWAEMSMGMTYQLGEGADLFRRSLYTIWKRTVAPPTLAVFDAASRETCWVTPKETNTPLQALTLLNETGFVESARHLAQRMLDSGGTDPLGYGFRLVTARSPSTAELDILREALAGAETFVSTEADNPSALLRVGASPMNKTHSPARLAAFTVIANMLLNLDEFINKE